MRDGGGCSGGATSLSNASEDVKFTVTMKAAVEIVRTGREVMTQESEIKISKKHHLPEEMYLRLDRVSLLTSATAKIFCAELSVKWAKPPPLI